MTLFTVIVSRWQYSIGHSCQEFTLLPLTHSCLHLCARQQEESSPDFSLPSYNTTRRGWGPDLPSRPCSILPLPHLCFFRLQSPTKQGHSRTLSWPSICFRDREEQPKGTPASKHSYRQQTMLHSMSNTEIRGLGVGKPCDRWWASSPWPRDRCDIWTHLLHL